MDFFEHQEVARRKTHVLIFYFLLAVLGIIGAIYALSVIGYVFMEEQNHRSVSTAELWRPQLFLITSIGVGSIISLASMFKTMQLSGGGKVVALELGGRKMDTNTTDYHERRLLNVVEEMAIAAGVPVPDVYVMDKEESINAFAAGKTTSDAVIGVTRGCMKLLTRDELQGVIAHEFSHILNGDMKLNMRLIGLLFGILFIALIGQIILRGVFHGSRYVRTNRKESGGIAIAILVVGVALLVVGYVGLFFANLIKASISRQREFLADASAVQFTRNPDGLAGALKKLGAPAAGSLIAHPMARDASHLFFGSALKGKLFATHPPLAERIKRLAPDWDGEFKTSELPPITEHSDSKPKKRGAISSHGPMILPGMFLAGEESSTHMTEAEALESMSSVHAEQIEFGHEMLANMPEQWITLAHSESGAQSIVFALLLGQDEALRNAERSLLLNATDQDTYDRTLSLHREVNSIHSAVKLGLIDLCIPTLRRLSPAEYERFNQIVTNLVNSDNQVNLFEFTLQKMVNRHLDTYFQIISPPRIKHRKIRRLELEASILISTISVLSNPENDAAIQEAFRHGAAHIEGITYSTLPFLSPDDCGLAAISDALDAFAQATPIVKQQILHACSKSLMSDNAVTSQEAELIRAIADAMGCAIPPFIRTAPLV